MGKKESGSDIELCGTMQLWLYILSSGGKTKERTFNNRKKQPMINFWTGQAKKRKTSSDDQGEGRDGSKDGSTAGQRTI